MQLVLTCSLMDSSWVQMPHPQRGFRPVPSAPQLGGAWPALLQFQTCSRRASWKDLAHFHEEATEAGNVQELDYDMSVGWKLAPSSLFPAGLGHCGHN